MGSRGTIEPRLVYLLPHTQRLHGVLDGDSVPNDDDNCPRIVNPDGKDVCFDGDGDGIPDTEDNCPKTQNFDQADFDNDGQGNLCDPDYRLNAEELAACRADHSPLQWALKCRATKRVGCTAMPGEPTAPTWLWWFAPGLLLARRRRR